MGEDGSLIECDVSVKNEAIRHFQKILSCSVPSLNGAGTLQTIIHNHISNDQADLINRGVTNEEIHDVCFLLHPNKASGPDGFNAHFFKKTWDIVGGDVINAVQEFFRTGELIKAFDTVQWDFLLETFAAFRVPSKVINWIKAFITTPKFSISINGELVGFFHSKRGLRQGDRMSLYVFVIAMEVLTKLLANHIQDSPHYKYHWKCDKIKVSHLCFADDLVMLCHGSTPSATILKMSLDDFSSLSGLKANPAKSNIFLLSVPNDSKQQLINICGYNVGSLPIRYLGILIISSKLSHLDCSPLLVKVSNRISSWMNHCLSYAGVDGNCKWAKVAWSNICLPKNEGGLGIKDVMSWNKALMIRHIWNLVHGSNNLWTTWIKTYHLKGGRVWEVKAPQTCSWNWRKLLKLHPIARPLIRHIIGNGLGTFCGLPNKAKVSSIVHGDQWLWPCSMSIVLLEIKNHVPSYNPNSSLEDCIKWLPTPDGIYSVASTTASIKTPHPLVPWFELVWYSHNIPMMSIILWLAIRGRLSTLDRVHLYNPHVGTLCVLCSSSPKTHAHIFFECAYSKVIWSHLKDMCGRPWNGHSWKRFIAWAAQRLRGKSLSIVVKKLCLAVAVYYI
ncbi:hypothetical protein Dsin_024682 [Dipteronia sinensis]|uniref:Reverse transcriptase domain-containing protein n=1 Tax=Dipteronia sinensis TaxID=43782 RepID=A0AAD9ZUF5_9ROSI|nr:hypothetical protein Dsin_024682 [Dipteronia sinensis]